MVWVMLGRFSARRPSTRAVRVTTCPSAASTLGEAAAIRRVASSTWPTADSITGRTASLVARMPAVVSSTDPTICRTFGPGDVDQLADLADRVAQVAPLDRPEPDLLQDRVEHRGLDPLDDLPRGQRRLRLADREDVDPGLPGQARLDRDPGVGLEPVGQVVGHRQADPGPEDPVDLGQGDADHPPRLDPGDPDLGSRRGCPGRRGSRRRSGGGAVRNPGPPPASAEQAHQGRHRQDDHQADADLASRGSSTHRGSLP